MARSRPRWSVWRLRQVGSLLLEGGAALHRAAWDERLVDFVRLVYRASASLARLACRFSKVATSRPAILSSVTPNCWVLTC